MPRILIAECIHEVCSFNPAPTRYEDFAIQRGPALFDYHQTLGSEVGGALQILRAEPNVELVPTFGARGITSGGVIGRSIADALGAGAEAAINLNLQTRNTGVTEIVRGSSAVRVATFNGGFESGFKLETNARPRGAK